jgi:pimeloyl-ACP methyl ester carboxylesterase
MRAAAFSLSMLAASAACNPAHAAPCPSTTTEALAVRGSTLCLSEEDLAPARRELLHAWVERSADIVANYYGRFPAPLVVLDLKAMDGSGVGGGRTMNDSGLTIHVNVGRDATAATLANDWVLVHEMVHLALPEVGRRHNWLAEGLAVYVEGVARAQYGNRAIADVWAEDRHSMPMGLPRAGEGGMDQTPTWGRTYWGGALFCLQAEVAIRRQTGNRVGLQTALQAILKETGGYAFDRDIDDVFHIGDAATGTRVLEDLYRDAKNTAQAPDLDALFSQLGVPKDPKTEAFDDHAPLAAIRIAITAPANPTAAASELPDFDYPYPVKRFEFTSQRQSLHMAYMDVAPQKNGGRTAVLLHGKNFCAATWRATIDVLSAAGYRVLAPDQIGFCKSTKPEHYQYSFQELARNTHALLSSLGIAKITLIGHSTGGMLAVRYALMYPAEIEQLVLVDPIGLEDWKAKGVPSISLDEWYARELKTSAQSIRDYERDTYYAGHWSDDYEPWVQMLAQLNTGPGKELVAWNSAALYDMIYTQPILYELGNLSVPTLLMIGDKDNTAIGKDFSPPAVRATLGHYPELGKSAARRIPHAKLIEFPALGHAPQIQDPIAFHKALLGVLVGKNTR